MSEIASPNIKPPTGNLSNTPDKATKKGKRDMTGESADDRIFFVDNKLFKYGTDDKYHAAALIISFLLLALIAIVLVGNTIIAIWNPTYAEKIWSERIFLAVWNGFIFVAGVAVGGSGRKGRNKG